MIGQTISHYKILEKLGEGGMGVVYKAHDLTLDRTVALKFLPQYLASDPIEKERFYHEARAASALNHPHITTIHEIKEYESQLYLAMEFVDGQTLKAIVEANCDSLLPIKRILDIAIQVCEGLSAAHEKGIVHRDMKSDNIMVTPKGQVKITDFGLAKMKGASKLTKTGSTIGTAAYMSPEQAQGEDVDQRSDIFSFGVVLYEMLTGRLPFKGEHQAALMYSLINEEPPPVARFNEKVTPELERIVSKAFAKDQDDRYQHVDDVLADLRRERKQLEYARAGYASISSAGAALQKKSTVLRYLILGSVIVGIIVLVVIFNPFNFQISTQKGGATEEKSTLAVMYFENIPDPDDKDHTGEMLTNLLTTSLFQTRDVEVISHERLYDLQKEFGQSDAKSISPSMATKIAQRAGVSMMLLGSILQKQPSLVITYRLIEVQSGKILSTQRLSGFSSENIFLMVDTLALLVKDDLHVTSTSPSEAKSVAEVTTKSPEAYRSYIEGVELEKKFFFTEAQAAFKKAIELDSTFAMAYANLQNIQKAWEFRDKVTEKERLLIEAQHALLIEKTPGKAGEIIEQLIQKYPHEQQGYLGLYGVYDQLNQHDKAIAALERALRVDSLDKVAWNFLAYAYADNNQQQQAFDAIDHYLRIAPAEPNPYDSKGDIFAKFGEFDSTLSWYKKSLAFRSDFINEWEKIGWVYMLLDSLNEAEQSFQHYGAFSPSKKAWSEYDEALILIHKGKLDQAQQRLLSNITTNKAQNFDDQVRSDYSTLIFIAYEKSDYQSMLAFAESSCVKEKKTEFNKIYSRDLLAWAYVKNGKLSIAQRLLDEVSHDVREEINVWRLTYGCYVALMAYEESKYDAAIEQYQKSFQFTTTNRAPQLYYGLSLMKAGRISEAIEEFLRVNHHADLSDRLGAREVIPSVKAHYWLGVTYEQQREKDKAIYEYQKFLETWKDADFKSKEIDNAKVRLAKLKSMALK
jgi:serine/threonine protein kinase